MLSFLKLLTLIAACAIFLLFAYTTTAYSLAQDAELASGMTMINETSSLANISHSRSVRQALGAGADDTTDDTDDVDPRDPRTDDDPTECSQGLVLPLWMPQKNITWGDRAIRGFVYFILMIYLFVGVSIISDRFMAAIEAITSTERTVTIKQPNGEKQTVRVRVWNETVANLTLMALGSSAPEIMLSVIEIYAKNFESGDLGPGTIVGSAAYNLFVIIALCMIAIPTGESRRIKHLRVFTVTAIFSVFAYIWLWAILAVISPGVIEVWEGIVTFLLFPVTVIWAYIAEKRLLVYKYLDKNYRVNKRGTVISGERDAVEMDTEKGRHGSVPMDADAAAFEEARREYIQVLTELRQKYPEADLEQLEMMAQEQIISRGSKSRAFYRVQATRKMIGSGNLMRKIQERAHSDLNEVKAQLNRDDDSDDEDQPTRIYFEPGHYTVMENCGEFEVRVVRRGDISKYSSVEFETQDGTATAGGDYIGRKGVLTFPPGVDEQRFKIEIIDDDIFEEDECFYIRLFNPSENVTLVVPQVATVMILDDDHAGIFAFSDSVQEISESVGIYELPVMRYSGARGTVIVPYWTEDDTAKAGKDFEPVQGELTFEDNATEQFISVPILEESSYEKDVTFKVHLGEPRLAPDDTNTESFIDRFFGDELLAQIQEVEKKKIEDLDELERILLLSKPKNGELSTVRIRIRESKEFRATVDKLVAKANVSAVLGTSSWKEQFKDALTVVPADESEFDNEDETEEEIPGCFDYISHFVCLFWKVLFAFVPPTDLCGGYITFCVSIIVIGLVTAVIGDAASYFGCALGIKDSVTAICFVALGTSIPDTFASLIAAKQDDTADNSIGNVTGSNAVNVYLGIGLAWSIASIYHMSNGNTFNVEPGTIGFAVALFCALAMIAFGIMMYRRNSKKIGAELGGPKSKWVHGSVLISLWILYLIISTLEAYHVFKI
ncbi:sodium/calcium exchanger 3 isoform X2 [Scaptodrosophila lebanonensis]|uniref:Sodium/calcium exchanger 3 isoform X2 n=1 Tax=Drosophila lebanonensis TaxID=7225 RepID=A0A6J2T2G0_DROLE|nr:sodium/calcium exchanger 3 isoform X2 [Scaptodrosophila lebanonensis]